MYHFNENTPPKEIIKQAMADIYEIMKSNGYKFLQGKSEIVKKTDDFTFRLYSQSNRWNNRACSAAIWLHCDVSGYWGKTLACSNAKENQFCEWEFYGEEQYAASLKEITRLITNFLLPFFRRFTEDLSGLVDEAAEKGFCVFGSEQVYDAGYHIPIEFLEKFGTKEQMALAFQHYYDRHQLDFVRTNLQNAVKLLKEGKEVTKNGEIDYAKYIVEHDLKLIMEKIQ
ncbi:hypothetical protein ACYULU_10885 [Breznakiellaceae bacterium SP9]